MLIIKIMMVTIKIPTMGILFSNITSRYVNNFLYLCKKFY